MKTKAVVYNETGDPLEITNIEIMELDDPEQDEVIVEVEAAPLHIADIKYMQGLITVLAPTPPAVAGIEGLGIVHALGDGVSTDATSKISIGDRVYLPRLSGTFRQYIKVKVAEITKASQEGDPLQLSLLPINGATSYVMLTQVIDLNPGEWIVQNGANSSCGRFNIGIAKKLGLKTVNIVRRPELVEDLQSLGADSVLVDGDDLAERVAEVTKNSPIRYAIDCVAGHATQRIAECLSTDGLLLSYGSASDQPCTINADLMYTRNLTVKGFLTPFYETNMSEKEKQEMMQMLTSWSKQGHIKAKIAATYSMDEYKKAIAHQMESGRGRDGKIILLPST